MQPIDPRRPMMPSMPPIHEECSNCKALQARVRELEQMIVRERKESEETIEQLDAINFRLKLLRQIEIRTETSKKIDEKVHAFCIFTLLTMATVVYFIVNRSSYATGK